MAQRLVRRICPNCRRSTLLSASVLEQSGLDPARYRERDFNQELVLEDELHVVVIQENRDLSNEITARTGYTHQSPQAFVLKDGKPVYHATHYGIDPARIRQVLSNWLGANASI